MGLKINKKQSLLRRFRSFWLLFCVFSLTTYEISNLAPRAMEKGPMCRSILRDEWGLGIWPAHKWDRVTHRETLASWLEEHIPLPTALINNLHCKILYITETLSSRKKKWTVWKSLRCCKAPDCSRLPNNWEPRAWSLELQAQLQVLGNLISIMLTVYVGEVFKCVSLNQTSLLRPNTKDENNTVNQSKPATGAKRGKIRASYSGLVNDFIGWESGASFATHTCMTFDAQLKSALTILSKEMYYIPSVEVIYSGLTEAYNTPGICSSLYLNKWSQKISINSW